MPVSFASVIASGGVGPLGGSLLSGAGLQPWYRRAAGSAGFPFNLQIGYQFWSKKPGDAS